LNPQDFWEDFFGGRGDDNGGRGDDNGGRVEVVVMGEREVLRRLLWWRWEEMVEVVVVLGWRGLLRRLLPW
jgi:hypothetical protein